MHPKKFREINMDSRLLQTEPEYFRAACWALVQTGSWTHYHPKSNRKRKPVQWHVRIFLRHGHWESLPPPQWTTRRTLTWETGNQAHAEAPPWNLGLVGGQAPTGKRLLLQATCYNMSRHMQIRYTRTGLIFHLLQLYDERYCLPLTIPPLTCIWLNKLPGA